MLTREERIEFGAWLKELRQAHGLLLKDVQRETKISTSYLSLIEAGDRNPPGPELLKSLARLYEVTPAEMLRRAGRSTSEAGPPNPDDIAKARLRRAYQYVIDDERISAGHRLTGEPTEEIMRMMVEMYQRLTGLNLLEEDPDAPAKFRASAQPLLPLDE